MPRNDAARRVKFFCFDGYTALPLLLVMLMPRWSTLGILLFVCIVLFLLERRGMNPPMLIRRLRVALIGRSRQIRPWWRRF